MKKKFNVDKIEIELILGILLGVFAFIGAAFVLKEITGNTGLVVGIVIGLAISPVLRGLEIPNMIWDVILKMVHKIKKH